MACAAGARGRCARSALRLLQLRLLQLQLQGPDAATLPGPVRWLDYGIRALVIALGAALGARWLAAPMKRLARAAGSLSAGLPQGARPPTLDERHGTREMREAAAAFNLMARRLQEQFDARGLHMAGVSHDLRTPLTRLRMRLEAFEGPQAEAAVADIHEMDGLIDSSLAVLREQRDGTPPVVVDLVALVQARIDDLAEVFRSARPGERPESGLHRAVPGQYRPLAVPGAATAAEQRRRRG